MSKVRERLTHAKVVSSIALCCVLGGGASVAHAAPGDLDSAWAGDGASEVTGTNLPYRSFPTSDGGAILAMGPTNETDFQEQRISFMKLGTSGLLDSGYGERVSSVGRLFMPERGADGKFVAIRIPGGLGDVRITRLLDTAQVDTTFGDAGERAIEYGPSGEGVNQVAVGPDGEVAVLGFYQGSAGLPASEFVARLTPEGDLDTNFGDGDGYAEIPIGGYDIAVQDDGKIVVSGSTPGSDVEHHHLNVMRLTTTGAPDPGFGGGDGLTTFDEELRREPAADSTFGPQGEIVVSGSGTSISGWSVAKLSADGTPDTGFGGDGLVEDIPFAFQTDASVRVAYQPDGKVLLAGAAGHPGNTHMSATLMRLNADGSIDTTFASDGIVTHNEDPDSRVDGRFVDVAVVAGGTRALAFGHSGDNGAFNFELFANRYKLDVATQHALTVAKAGAGSGTVTGSGINCGSDCTEAHDEGTTVTLTAAAAAGSQFSGWTNCDDPNGLQCQVEIDAAKTVTATFSLGATPTQTLTVTKTGAGSGIVESIPGGIDCGGDCSEAYAQGTTVTLDATPAAGSQFAGWTGCDSLSAGDCVMAMSAAKSVTATFTPEGTTTPVDPDPINPDPVGPNPPAAEKPNTEITKVKVDDKKGTAKVSFEGSGGTGKLSFECKLDNGKFKPCSSPKKLVQRCSGERHEDLPADDADRHPFDGNSLHFRTGTAVGNPPAIADRLSARTRAVEQPHSVASGNTPFPAKISCTSLLGTPDSSLSISAGWICAGARPPLMARTSTRIAGAWDRCAPAELRGCRSRGRARPAPRQARRRARSGVSTPPDFSIRRAA